MNEIEIGNDSIDNYSGAERQLLEIEASSRLSALDGDMQTRSTWYRKQKVIEYAKFIDGMQYASLSTGDEYEYDANFILAPDHAIASHTIEDVDTDDVHI